MCVNETVFNDAMLTTVVVHSPFTATLREPETRVSRCSLASSLTTKLLTHSTKTQTSNISSPLLGCSTTQLVASLQKIFVSCSLSATLVIKSQMNASLQEVCFVTSCSIIVTTIRRLLAYANSLLSNGHREFKCTSF